MSAHIQSIGLPLLNCLMFKYFNYFMKIMTINTVFHLTVIKKNNFLMQS